MLLAKLRLCITQLFKHINIYKEGINLFIVGLKRNVDGFLFHDHMTSGMFKVAYVKRGLTFHVEKLK
jgi:hypothetical protein